MSPLKCFPYRRALIRMPLGIVRAALVVRVVDEWWSYLPAGAIGDLRRDLGITYSQAGWLLALLTLGALAGAPLGAIADRGHRRLLACSGAALLSAGLVVYVLGTASDLVIRPVESSLAELAGDDLDRLLGRQHFLTWAGDLVGPAVLALGAATWLGWQGAFALTAGSVACYGILLALTEFPSPQSVDDDEPTMWRSAVPLATSREVLLLAGAELIMTPLDEAFLGFAVARLIADDLGALAQVLAVGLFAGGLIGSAVVSRRGLSGERSVRAALLLGVGATMTAVSPWLGVQLAGMAAMGAGTAVVWTSVHHRSLTAVPGKSSMVPTVVGVLSTPALLIPAAIGWLADVTSLTVGLVASASLSLPLIAIVMESQQPSE
jgi:MFS family permease